MYFIVVTMMQNTSIYTSVVIYSIVIYFYCYIQCSLFLKKRNATDLHIEKCVAVIHMSLKYL